MQPAPLPMQRPKCNPSCSRRGTLRGVTDLGRRVRDSVLDRSQCHAGHVHRQPLHQLRRHARLGPPGVHRLLAALHHCRHHGVVPAVCGAGGGTRGLHERDSRRALARAGFLRRGRERRRPRGRVRRFRFGTLRGGPPGADGDLASGRAGRPLCGRGPHKRKPRCAPAAAHLLHLGLLAPLPARLCERAGAFGLPRLQPVVPDAEGGEGQERLGPVHPARPVFCDSHRYHCVLSDDLRSRGSH
mmetsp:Transcript_38204/g.114113  ORF Transcript_38204/g.114113 Transcript_38204/m.114113 type:complete len:243 (+) Transcript_38204:87-815(+)